MKLEIGSMVTYYGAQGDPIRRGSRARAEIVAIHNPEALGLRVGVGDESFTVESSVLGGEGRPGADAPFVEFEFVDGEGQTQIGQKKAQSYRVPKGTPGSWSP